MREHLTGETYYGRYLVADAKVRLACPPERARLVVGSTGFVLLSPLPDNRWLIFRQLRRGWRELSTGAELGTLLNTRTGVDLGLSDLCWVSHFKMHKRMVERLSDGRRFLWSDAADMSSPLGGHGLNAALMDAADIAWKLALVVRGAAKPSLLDSCAIERGGSPTATSSTSRTSYIAWWWDLSRCAMVAVSHRKCFVFGQRQEGSAKCDEQAVMVRG
jgi:2-polyprenyl-6-methoxyphenol hydroxylase-like FAD-dependent oxidoreductase